MIKNNICEECDRVEVCKIADKLAPFSEDAKKDLGVTIEIDTCENYKQMETEE